MTEPNKSLLELLCIDMRALGIRSLALELEPLSSEPLPSHADDGDRTESRERDTLAPDTSTPEDEPKDPTLCIADGCGEKNGGLFGGSAGGLFCRKHALARAGVGR